MEKKISLILSVIGIIVLYLIINGIIYNNVFKFWVNVYMIPPIVEKSVQFIFSLIISLILVYFYRTKGIIASIIVFLIPIFLTFIVEFIGRGPKELFYSLTHPSDMPIKWNIFYGIYKHYIARKTTEIFGLLTGLIIGSIINSFIRK